MFVENHLQKTIEHVVVEIRKFKRHARHPSYSQEVEAAAQEPRRPKSGRRLSLSPLVIAVG
jgi:hypothetical protein